MRSAQRAQLQQRSERAESRLKELKDQLGLEPWRKLPATGDRKHGVPVLASMLAERSPADVATALKRAGSKGWGHDAHRAARRVPRVPTPHQVDHRGDHGEDPGAVVAAAGGPHHVGPAAQP